MKTKMVLILMVFFILSSFHLTGKANGKTELKITINENGEFTNINGEPIATNAEGEEIVSLNGAEISVEKILNQKFKKGTIISIFLECALDCPKSRCEVNKKDIEPETIPIYAGPKLMASLSIKKKTKPTYKVTLSESGKIYKIKILMDKLIDGKEKEDVVFERDFETYARYYLGLHVGFLFPFERSTSYGILYRNLDDTTPIITRRMTYDTRMLLYGALYPFGYEPQRPIFSQPLKRVHIDLGTELSGNIFKKLYLGIGYDFRYFSLSLFACRENIGVLQPGFEVGGEINPLNPDIPLNYKSHTSFGVAFGLPFNIAGNWLGKILSL
ncbi:MAG: hypothetical protein ACM3SY_19550 [Candidatus Omnitrophota bacterium]